MTSRISHTTFDARDAYAQSVFWAQVLGYTDVPGDPNLPGHEECMIVPPADATTPVESRGRVLFVEVPDDKQLKNRVHLDLRPTDGSREEEVERLLLEEVQRDERFVFAAVKGNYGDAVLPYYKAAVLVEVPREIRLQRVQQRSLDKFGDRARPGGDLYEREKWFFDHISARPEDYASRWLGTMNIPILQVDGTRPVGENLTVIEDWLRRLHS